MEYYDQLETRDPQTRREAHFAALSEQINHAQRRSRAFARILADIDSASIITADALAQLPVTRKSELTTLAKQDPPFGGLATAEPGEFARVFSSPGPIYEPESHRPDYWRLARALFAAGFRRGDLVHNSFAYHFTPAGSMVEGAARALGCAVFPAGVGQTELQAQSVNDLRPDGYTGTPSFLKIMLDKAAEMNLDTTSLRKAVVSGEALPPSLRDEISAQGIEVLQCYASADLGLIAYESPAKEGLIVDEGVLVEIVRPGTGDVLPEGEVGEVVVTTFNPDYPLIRFGTGDLSAIMAGVSPCGRTNMRIKGWMGRADQTTKVRGMFVTPTQVVEVVKRYPEIKKGRLVVGRQADNDTMTLYCETEEEGSPDLANRIAASLRDVCKLRGDVVFAAIGSLANDGKVIDDIRKYD
ncbi:MAG: AMP-binding protein [Gammaproteobacteria bacterium]|nr:AMP-binding protein [Gammaproteobacteria bacterium]